MANHWDFAIEQGSTFVRTLTITRNGRTLDLTGYRALWQFRPSIQSQTVIIQLTNVSGLTLGGVAGTILMLITASATDAITSYAGVHELRLTDATGAILPRLRGRFWLVPKIAATGVGAAYSSSYNFSDARNSQYIFTLPIF